MIKKMLKRREECHTYLTHVCRHYWGIKSPVKIWNLRSCQTTLWLLSAVDIDSLYSWWKPQYWVKTPYIFIFSLGSICSSDMYRHESGRCRNLPVFLTFSLSVKLFTPSGQIWTPSSSSRQRHLCCCPWHVQLPCWGQLTALQLYNLPSFSW